MEEVANRKGLDIHMESNLFSFMLFMVLTFLVHLKLAGLVISEGALFTNESIGNSIGGMIINSDIGFSNLTSVILTANMPLTSMMLFPVAIVTAFVMLIVFSLIIQLFTGKIKKEA